MPFIREVEASMVRGEFSPKGLPLPVTAPTKAYEDCRRFRRMLLFLIICLLITLIGLVGMLLGVSTTVDYGFDD